MAIVKDNPLVKGLSGMLGRTVVFKNLRGKTILANYPAPVKKRSERQRNNSLRFKEATMYAKRMMLDPERKEYYWKKARKLKLPNAYTAAITDYMRKPVVTKVDLRPSVGEGQTQIAVEAIKKDFELKNMELKVISNYKIIEGRPVPKGYGLWTYVFRTADLPCDSLLELGVKDDPGQLFTFVRPLT